MASNFPTSMDDSASIVIVSDGNDLVLASHQNQKRDAILAIEEKIGKDASTDVDTLDYKVKSSSAVDTGHEHTDATIIDGTGSGIDVDSLGGVTADQVGGPRLIASSNTWASTGGSPAYRLGFTSIPQTYKNLFVSFVGADIGVTNFSINTATLASTFNPISVGMLWQDQTFDNLLITGPNTSSTNANSFGDFIIGDYSRTDATKTFFRLAGYFQLSFGSVTADLWKEVPGVYTHLTSSAPDTAKAQSAITSLYFFTSTNNTRMTIYLFGLN